MLALSENYYLERKISTFTLDKNWSNYENQ